jgi:hypothetical protein
MLKIHETTTATGELAPVYLTIDHGVLAIVAGDEKLGLTPAALDAVMKRFGAPLDRAEPLSEVARLDLGGGRSLRHVRHLGHYDVIARDYLVDETPDREPLCALATTVTGALMHLARAAAAPAR